MTAIDSKLIWSIRVAETMTFTGENEGGFPPPRHRDVGCWAGFRAPKINYAPDVEVTRDQMAVYVARASAPPR
jgi:hypothetical protein